MYRVLAPRREKRIMKTCIVLVIVCIAIDSIVTGEFVFIGYNKLYGVWVRIYIYMYR